MKLKRPRRKKPDKLHEMIVPIGTLIHIHAVPFTLACPAIVSGHYQNFKLITRPR